MCNPAKDCAAIKKAGLGDGVYTIGDTSSAERAFCHIIPKEDQFEGGPETTISFDGRSAKKPAYSCAHLQMLYPYKTTGKYYIGTVKENEQVDCDGHGLDTPSNVDKRVPLNGLAAWWDAADYDQNKKQWPRHKAKQLCDSNPGSLGGWGCTARVTSGHPKRSSGGNNAAKSYPAIVGYSHGSGDNFNFGSIAPAGRQHTLCTTSKYDGGHRGRIFTGHHTNWLHGHWGNNNGVSHYDHWIVYSGRKNHRRFDWLIWCFENRQGKVWMNNDQENAEIARPYGSHSRGTNRGTREVCVGACTHGGERSNYKISQVMTWNRALSDEEMKGVTQFLTDQMRGKV